VPGAAKLLIAAGVLGLAASGIALCNIAGDRQFPTIVASAAPEVVDGRTADDNRVVVTVKNRARTPVKITAVSTTCGCTAPDSLELPIEIPARAAVEIPFTVGIPSLGEKHVQIRIGTDSPDAPELAVPFKIVGKEGTWNDRLPRLVVAPKSVELTALFGGTATRALTISTLEPAGTERWLGQPRAGDSLTIRLVDLQESPGPEPATVARSYRFEATSTRDIPKVNSRYIQVDLVDRDGNLLQPSARIEFVCRVVSPVRVVPAALVFSRREAESRTVVFECRDPEHELTVEPAALPAGFEAVIDREASRADRVVYRLSVNAAADSESVDDAGAAASGTLTFHTNHPEQPSIEIPVLIKPAVCLCF